MAQRAFFIEKELQSNMKRLTFKKAIGYFVA